MAHMKRTATRWSLILASTAAGTFLFGSCDNRTEEAQGYDRLGISIHDSTSQQGLGVTPAPKSTLPRTEPVPRPELVGEVPRYHEHKEQDGGHE